MKELSHAHINHYADDKNGPVALHMRQSLIPVDGKDGIIFPPTYAKIDYNIDTLSDGTKVATIDSVGAQANRIEPIFKDPPYAKLVPQIDILDGNEKLTTIFDASHRLGDALIRCTNLQTEAHNAFEAFKDRNDASKIAKIAPTSLVFGTWDSRDTQAKLPRIVQSVIRAWNVEELSRSAQYNPTIDYVELNVVLKPKDKKEKDKLAEDGFVHVPAAETHGGIIAKGGIERQVTVNLVALRRLKGKDDKDSEALRRYVLGLSLVAAVAPLDPFLRQGCLLVPDPEKTAEWSLVERNGSRNAVNLNEEIAHDYARATADAFGVGENRCLTLRKSKGAK